MASDDFSATNSPLASPWTGFGGSFGNLRSVSGGCRNVAGSDADAGAYYSSSSSQSSQVDYISGSTDGGPALNMGVGPDGYVDSAYNGTEIFTFRVDDGSVSAELGHATGVYVATLAVKLRRSGSNLITSLAGVDTLTVTDATYTGGSPGILCFSGDFIVDNWTDGVSSGQTLSPTAIATASTFGSQTVSHTDKTLPPTAIATAAVFGSHSISNMAGGTLLPTAIASAVLLGSHTLSHTDQTISPTAVASAVAFGSHTIVKDVTSAGIPSAAVFGTQTVVKDGQTIQMTGIASAATFGSHTLSQAAQSLLPTAIGTAAVFGSHTVADVNLVVAPAGIASAAVFGSPLVMTAGTQAVISTGIASAVAFGSETVANVAAQAVVPTAVSTASVYGVQAVALTPEIIIVSGIGTAGWVSRPTLTGGSQPTEFYIGSSNVTIDDRVEEDRHIGESNVQFPLGDLS